MNHRSVLQYEVPNDMGAIVLWWRNLQHSDLLGPYIENLLNLESSGVMIHEILFITILVE